MEMGNSFEKPSQLYLMNNYRKLWEQHIMWTRSFIISTAANLGDLEIVTKRLLKNPSDFAFELRTFYGKEKANEFEKLFSNHLLIAAKLVNDAKSGKSMMVENDRKQWYKNADDISLFLSNINPYWDRKVWQTMLYDHLKMTENEAVERLKGKYEKDIMLYDSIENEALKMADMMSSGIIKQFKV